MAKKPSAAQLVAQGAIIAALYVVLTMVFAPISFGAMQVRIAEALTILPLFTPAAIPGLFVGCVLANLLGGAIIWDVIFGSLATLIGAALGWVLRRNRWLVPIPAVVSNGIIVPLVLKYGYSVDMPLLLIALYVVLGEIVGCYLLGELLGGVLLKRGQIFRK
jgi:uncharacterized membrane protein